MKAGETRMLDWRGQEVKVGDIVVYPGRHKNDLWMVEAEVVELHSMIEDQGDPSMPTQVGGATVRRLRQSSREGVQNVEPREVNISLHRLMVVTPVEVLERERYPMRYLVPPSDIEIDGRAS